MFRIELNIQHPNKRFLLSLDGTFKLLKGAMEDSRPLSQLRGLIFGNFPPVRVHSLARKITT